MSRTMSLALAGVLAGGIASADTPSAQIDVDAITDVTFAFDSSTLPFSAELKLNRVIDRAKERPESRIILGGYTDPIGTEPYNVGLAIRRAEAVRDALIDRGIDRQRIVVEVFAEHGQRAAGYPANRRVDIGLSIGSMDELGANTFAMGGTAVRWGTPMTVAAMAERGGVVPSSTATARR
jgi:outer membrane protein OmpA-like peptidoglycan-associated protein